jgi:heme/copper-type cytochrome/quinol oxidase subunit 2
MRLFKPFRTLAAATGVALTGAAAWAQDLGDAAVAATVDGLPIIGQPIPNGINWQPSVTDISQDSRWLDGMVNWIILVTGGDVIHSWTIPAFGVKQDAVPGRLAHLWFNAETEGVYFGQCSELCGKDHAFMPITVRVVSPEAYEAWIAEAQAEFPAS